MHAFPVIRIRSEQDDREEQFNQEQWLHAHVAQAAQHFDSQGCFGGSRGQNCTCLSTYGLTTRLDNFPLDDSLCLPDLLCLLSLLCVLCLLCLHCLLVLLCVLASLALLALRALLACLALLAVSTWFALFALLALA